MWPFTRKPNPLNPGPINEDWRVGDLAECLGDGWTRDSSGEPSPDPVVKGDIYQVVWVGAMRTKRSGDAWILAFKGSPDGWTSTGFRKVPPLNSAATAEFTAQIKALKPKRAKA